MFPVLNTAAKGIDGAFVDAGYQIVRQSGGKLAGSHLPPEEHPLIDIRGTAEPIPAGFLKKLRLSVPYLPKGFFPIGSWTVEVSESGKIIGVQFLQDRGSYIVFPGIAPVGIFSSVAVKRFFLWKMPVNDPQIIGSCMFPDTDGA